MSRSAASCNYSDVDIAVNGGGPDSLNQTWYVGGGTSGTKLPAPDGETVILPNVSGTWINQKLVINKNITLQGGSGINAGRTGFVDRTIINFVGSGTILTWNTTENTAANPYTATLRGITMVNPDTNSSYSLILGGLARFNRSNNTGGFRMTECHFAIDPTPARTKNDGQSFSDTNFDSNSAQFTPLDIGKVISGTNIQAATVISSYVSVTRVVLSKPTTGTGINLQFTIAAATGKSEKRIATRDWVTGVMDHCIQDLPYNVNGTYFIEANQPSQPGFVGNTTVRVSGGVDVSVTLTPGNPGVVTYGTQLKVGQGVTFSVVGASGLSITAVYFVANPTTSTFNLTAVPLGTTLIAFSGSGSINAMMNACNNFPKQGAYSWSTPWNWGNDFEGMYIEDCIFQRVGFTISQADGPTPPGNGGSRLVMRHCSTWGSFSGHGFDDAPSCGEVCNEAYNNFIFCPPGTPGITTVPKIHNVRGGGMVYFNERFLNMPVIGPSVPEDTAHGEVGYPSFYRNSASKGFNVIGPGDGCCFFDLNARGGLLKIKEGGTGRPKCKSYLRWETTASGAQTLPTATLTVASASTTDFPSSGNIYVNTASGTQAVAYTGKTSNSFTGCSGGSGAVANGAVVVGPLTITYLNSTTGATVSSKTYAPVRYQLTAAHTPTSNTDFDTTTVGVPDDDRIGAIYAQGTGATGGSTSADGKTGTQGPYTLPNFGSASDNWDGFADRNRNRSAPESAGGQVDNPFSGGYHQIISSSFNSATGATTINVQGAPDPVPGTWVAGDVWEFRYQVFGMALPGAGTIPFSDGAVKGGERITFYALDSKGRNKYYQQLRAGIWYWDMKYCASFANLNTASPTIVDTDFKYGETGKYIVGGLHNDIRTTAKANDPHLGIVADVDFDFPEISNSNSRYTDYLRIGADWDSGNFGGPLGTLATAILSTNTKWPATRAWGSTYPHPLIQAPANSVPVITGPTPFSASFVAGVASSVTISASGTPSPTFSMPTPGTGGVPTWASLSSGGSLSVTTSSVVGTYSFTVTASNTPGAGTGTDSATFTLNITALNVAPTVTLTSPADNAAYFTTDTISFSANASDPDGGVTKVQFFAGTTQLGSDITTPPYQYSQAISTAGNYNITAKATDTSNATTTSSIAHIQVTNQPQPTLAAPNIVVTG